MSRRDSEHRWNRQQAGRGGLSAARLDEIKGLPPVYDWEIFDNKGRHVAYMDGKTEDQAEPTAKRIAWLCRREFGRIEKVQYPQSSKEARLLTRAMSEERFGSPRKAAAYRGHLTRRSKLNSGQ
jgi:hypothetical protein